MPILSVVIPVYKVEQYLPQCVDSVLNQDLDDLEIILVDDGSPDSCPAICDDYATRYENIKVIHQENSGSSSARNAGIYMATGTYITFLDSDDWWSDQVSLKAMVDEIMLHPEVEFALCTCTDFIPNIGFVERRDKLLRRGSVPIKNFYDEVTSSGNLREAAYTKILKRDFLLTNKLFFQEGITGEDSEWFFRVLRHTSNVYLLPESLPIYRFARAESISNTISAKTLSDSICVIEQSAAYYANETEISNLSIRRGELTHCAYLLSIAISMYCQISKSDRGSMKAKIKQLDYLLDLGINRKCKLTRVVYKAFGLTLTSRILATYVYLMKKNIIPTRRIIKNG